jgi:hypothetical protein
MMTGLPLMMISRCIVLPVEHGTLVEGVIVARCLLFFQSDGLAISVQLIDPARESRVLKLDGNGRVSSKVVQDREPIKSISYNDITPEFLS